MNTTIIVCTYNRCKSLAKTLESIATLRVPGPVEWEVLVVDNNSTDQTRAVVEGFSCRYPSRFRYLFEPQQGKSCALNAGIQAARGEILAFTDDDVTVEPDMAPESYFFANERRLGRRRGTDRARKNVLGSALDG